jgi:hypothetical protein
VLGGGCAAVCTGRPALDRLDGEATCPSRVDFRAYYATFLERPGGGSRRSSDPLTRHWTSSRNSFSTYHRYLIIRY